MLNLGGILLRARCSSLPPAIKTAPTITCKPFASVFFIDFCSVQIGFLFRHFHGTYWKNHIRSLSGQFSSHQLG
ncbi:hypothetical protein L218DRAFT_112540 [Marasmius fiardii PR-910]|nr:hypothetical protein L218DRAFT_112540 [Marasmius fiardii PR-910]